MASEGQRGMTKSGRSSLETPPAGLLSVQHTTEKRSAVGKTPGPRVVEKKVTLWKEESSLNPYHAKRPTGKKGSVGAYGACHSPGKIPSRVQSILLPPATSPRYAPAGSSNGNDNDGVPPLYTPDAGRLHPAAEKPLRDTDVTALTGGEHFEEIEVLVARDMKLTTLSAEEGACDWQKFIALSSLSLSHNRLTDITPLLVLAPTLIDVNVSFNEISDLSPLFCCLSLRRLQAAHNAVRSILGIQRCKKLETLLLYHNCLDDSFPLLVKELSSLKHLSELDLDANPGIFPANEGSVELAGGDSSQGCSAEKRPSFEPAATSVRCHPDMLDLILCCCPTIRVLAGQPVPGLTPTCELKSDGEPSETNGASDEVGDARQSPRTSPSKPEKQALDRVRQRNEDSDNHDGGPPTVASETDASPSDTSPAGCSGGRDLPEAVDCWSEDEAAVRMGMHESESVAALKETIEQLKMENRNMHTVIEENAQLRSALRLRLPTVGKPEGALWQRTCSARPVSSGDRSLWSLKPFCSARPSTAAPGCLAPRAEKPTHAAVPVVDPAAAIPCRADGPSLAAQKQVSCLPSPTEQKAAAVDSPSASASVVHSSSPAVQKGDRSGTPHSGTQRAETDLDRVAAAEDQVEILRWENGLLRKRLDRMVAYIELLRRDLQEARRKPPGQYGSSQEPAALSCTQIGTARVLPSPPNAPLPSRGSQSERYTPPAKRSATDEHGQEDSESDDDSDAELLPISGILASRSSPRREASDAKSQAIEAVEGRPTTAETLLGSSTSPGAKEKRELHLTGAPRCPPGQSDIGLSGDEDCSSWCDVDAQGRITKAAATLRQEDAELQDLIERNEQNLKALRRDLRTTEKILSRPPSAARVLSSTSRLHQHGPLSSAASPPPPSPPAPTGLLGIEPVPSTVTAASVMARSCTGGIGTRNPRETADASRMLSGSSIARAAQIASITAKQRTEASNKPARATSKTMCRSSSKGPSQVSVPAYEPLKSSRITSAVSPQSRLLSASDGLTRMNREGPLSQKIHGATSAGISRLSPSETRRGADLRDEPPHAAVSKHGNGGVDPRTTARASQHDSLRITRAAGVRTLEGSQLPPLRALHRRKDSLPGSS